MGCAVGEVTGRLSCLTVHGVIATARTLGAGEEGPGCRPAAGRWRTAPLRPSTQQCPLPWAGRSSHPGGLGVAGGPFLADGPLRPSWLLMSGLGGPVPSSSLLCPLPAAAMAGPGLVCWAGCGCRPSGHHLPWGWTATLMLTRPRLGPSAVQACSDLLVRGRCPQPAGPHPTGPWGAGRGCCRTRQMCRWRSPCCPARACPTRQLEGASEMELVPPPPPPPPHLARQLGGASEMEMVPAPTPGGL